MRKKQVKFMKSAIHGWGLFGTDSKYFIDIQILYFEIFLFENIEYT